MVRDAEQGWVYAGTDISAVGARDVTLGEAVNPLVVGRRDEEPEAVLLPLSAIIQDQRLNWALQAGRKLDGDEEPMFKVLWSVWQEHAAEPVDAWLPESDGTGLDRSLAIAERELRFAKQTLDVAAAARHRLVVLAIRLGWSRREVGKTIGLSTGRVQQLSETPPIDVVRDVEDFLRSASQIATLLGTSPCRREDIPRPRDLGSDRFDEVVEFMLELGLLEERPEGVSLTEDGQVLVDRSGADKGRVGVRSQDRERVSDADG